jgi:outer membrane receptor protein involved in Fe transport
MMPKRIAWSALVMLVVAGMAEATIYGSIRGLVHDPQHRPISGAEVMVRAEHSDWQQSTASNADGEFQLSAVPVGEYDITITAPGFSPQQRRLVIASGSAPVLHFALGLARATTSIEVVDSAETVVADSSTPSSIISREQIARTPGADRTNSMAMITDFVPGAYVVHDQLHIRGGHQMEWLLDGVPVPNTNIASNVGPQFDPKDIDYLEVQRGGYSAEYGDRAYSVLNVVTRSGFERNNEGQIITSYGTQNSTDNQISLGSHTERFAYYASVSGNRSDLGLETPTPAVLHDLGAGLSAFGSLIFNKTARDQLRLISALRGDHYQVPNEAGQQALGIRDVEDERDFSANFSWLHTWSTGTLLTLSPFYHFNRAHYMGGLNRSIFALDPAALNGTEPLLVPEDNRASHYAGGVITLAVLRGKHNAHFGMSGFAQHDNQLFGISRTGAAGELRETKVSILEREQPSGGVAAFFVQDQYKLQSWLTLTGGLRMTHFSGPLAENAAGPRAGAAVTLPRLRWVIRGFYGRYYQPPPLLSVAGPVLALAAEEGFGFLPLHGERDEQHEFGVSIPFSGWVAELDHFRTKASNFLDHDVLGNSNIFFPVTLEGARIRGWEATVRSPRLFQICNLQIVYSRQVAQARGTVSGGLTDFAPPTVGGYYFLDHDQRHIASLVARFDLPWRAHLSTALLYGSGFLDGDGPAHLPAHTTADISVGKPIGEKIVLQLSVTNLTNRRYLLDNSNTFGGTHWANPRQVAMQVRYRFRY